jgi:regulator of cell morphogenesis and NO signaling
MPVELTMDEREYSLSGAPRDILAARHASLRERVAAALELSAAVTSEQKPPFCRILLPLRRLFQRLQEELEAYIGVEERDLLPSLQELDENRRPGNDLMETIRFLRHGQSALVDVLSEMRDLTHDFGVPEDACASYPALMETLRAIRTDLLIEFDLENKRIFPHTAKAMGS